MTKDRPKRAASRRSKRYYNPSAKQKEVSAEDIAQKTHTFEQNEHIKQHLDCDGRKQWVNLRNNNRADNNNNNAWAYFKPNKIADFAFYPKYLGGARDVKKYGQPGVHYALGYDGLADMARRYGGDLMLYRPPPLDIPPLHVQQPSTPTSTTTGDRASVAVAVAVAYAAGEEHVDFEMKNDDDEKVHIYGDDDLSVNAVRVAESDYEDNVVQEEVVAAPETPQFLQSQTVVAAAVRSLDAPQANLAARVSVSPAVEAPVSNNGLLAAQVNANDDNHLDDLPLEDRVARAEELAGHIRAATAGYHARLSVLERDFKIVVQRGDYRQRIAAIEAKL